MMGLHGFYGIIFCHYFCSEDHNVDIAALDIAVNAVATAVKDFFFKRLPPVLPEEQMADLETVSSEYAALPCVIPFHEIISPLFCNPQ